MKGKQTSKEEMLKWLNEHKLEHEMLALGALQHGGSQRYIQENNHKAMVVTNIIKIVERGTNDQ